MYISSASNNLYVDFSKYIEYFIHKDQTVLLELLDEDEFHDEIADYLLNELGLCEKCFSEITQVTQKECLTTDPYPMYQDMLVGFKCDNCGYEQKYY